MWKVYYKGEDKKKYLRVNFFMESAIDSMSGAYGDFVAAAAGVIRAREASGGRRSAATDVALENFWQRWEVFKASCDQAEEVMDMARRRIAMEHAMDVATGRIEPARSRLVGLPPVSVPHLGRALHAVNSLAADLRRESGGAAVSSSSSPSVVTPSEDKAD